MAGYAGEISALRPQLVTLEEANPVDVAQLERSSALGRLPYRFQVGGDRFLYSRRIGQLLRWDAPVGEEDLRPDSLDLRAVTTRHLLIELDVNSGSCGLIDGYPGVTSAEIEVGDLFLADRRRRRIDDYDDVLRMHIGGSEGGENQCAKR